MPIYLEFRTNFRPSLPKGAKGDDFPFQNLFPGPQIVFEKRGVPARMFGNMKYPLFWKVAILVLSQSCLTPALGAISVATGTGYTVKEGDTFLKIACSHGVTVDALLKANRISNADYIRAGDGLVIPGA